MANYICPRCNANNAEPGGCIICQARLGSLRLALATAILSSVMIAVIWILLSVFTGIQLPALALFFGCLVAGLVSRVSGGRGFSYQAIATAFTAAGIVAGDSISLLVIWWREQGGGWPSSEQILQDMAYRFEQDPYTILFYAVGVMGSLYIWKY